MKTSHLNLDDVWFDDQNCKERKMKNKQKQTKQNIKQGQNISKYKKEKVLPDGK